MTEDELLDQLHEAEHLAVKASGTCAMCLAISQMSDRVRPAVEAGLEGKIGERTLSRILIEAGYDVSRRSISYHRSGHTKRRA